MKSMISAVLWIRNSNDFRKIETNSLIIGFFDALHKGHMKLRNVAKKPITVITFKFAKYNKFVYGIDKRIEMIQQHFCPNQIVVFDLDKCNWTSNEFMDYLKKYIKPCEIIIGSDFRFGSDLQNWKALQKYFNVRVIKRRKYNNISTTIIKKLLEMGKVSKANKLMLAPYSYSAKVIHGNKLARQLGWPTANLEINRECSNLGKGIYLSNVVMNGVVYPAITFIGETKTKGIENKMKFENHLLNYNGPDFYNKDIEVQLIKKIGKVKKYKSINCLKNGVNKLIKKAKYYFGI